MREEKYKEFLKKINERLLTHRIIQNNSYCKWFREADLTLKQVKDLTVQFSVFSNWFLVAQLKKTINAPDLESMRAAKEILANEIGVLYHKKGSKPVEGLDYPSEGSVDGGTFHFTAGHFEWLLKFAKPLGLGFKDLGHRKHGTESTLFFVDELDRIYGSEDFTTSVGASYAVEHWAHLGFWKDLIQGLTNFKEKSGIKIPLGFFIWHDLVEDQHAAHTDEELKEIYMKDENFDEELFIRSGNEMLDGVAAFWDGLFKTC
ncbi:MAG: hypothetical protein E2O68_04025 [Deltaproteobacteria bacterium]|nr:MAG: hypothetical protein E2O68_04025 [Deltaproteobacteria bacterium]